MESSRRAVESYWRSRMIDGATSDEDKVTPVYKLDEICELLRSSHVSVVKEVSEFILKRLEHRSPVVKQKALRLIKFAVGKSGPEFRREMQRNSVAVRQLAHYKGQPDPLKGDALNKAVRETANEAIAAIFSEENKPTSTDNVNRRIQGFGNTNFEMPSEDKKSFLSEVVGLGSASIKQGLSSFTQGHSFKMNENGSYKGPTLRRSLTTEIDHSESTYEPVRLQNDSQGSLGISKNTTSGPWGQDSRVLKAEPANGEHGSSHSESKTREERLLETIVTSGGVRLQPSRDAIRIFLVEAAKLDALALSHALERKLQSPMWQVRVKAVCVLESILRKKEDKQFSVMASYFSENKDVLEKCSESPQGTLREKASKVLGLLNAEKAGGSASNSEVSTKAGPSSAVQLPDLIDTGDPEDLLATDGSTKSGEQNAVKSTPPAALIDDLFGDGMSGGTSSIEQKNDDDPFADVAFYTGESEAKVDELFSGIAVDDKSDAEVNQVATDNEKSNFFDIFGVNAEVPTEHENNKNVDDLMSGLSMNENSTTMKQKGASSDALAEYLFSNMSTHPTQETSGEATATLNANQIPQFPLGGMPYNFPPGLMLNPALFPQAMNYGAMGSLIAQQQLLLSNFQQLGNFNAQNVGVSQVGGTKGGYSSAMPDIFQSNFATQTPNSMTNSSKKEETRAFDFISDHVAAARDSKRVV